MAVGEDDGCARRLMPAIVMMVLLFCRVPPVTRMKMMLVLGVVEARRVGSTAAVRLTLVC